MIQFFSISTFRKRLADLLSVKRGVYGNVRKEIIREFTDKSIEEIRQNRDMILLQDDITVVKLRLPDKKMRLSRKDGYRLIYLVSREVEVVTFLDIYPKNGPSQQLDLSESRLKELLIEFIHEFESVSLLREHLE